MLTFVPQSFEIAARPTGVVLSKQAAPFSLKPVHKYQGILRQPTIILLFAAMLLAFVQQDEPEDAAALGQMLFKDPILSSDRSIACSSCHLPAFSFSDTVAVSKGVGGALGTRNTPAITNMAARSAFFWDGRAATLEQQVLMPIQTAHEMNLPLPMAVERLRSDENYRHYFKKIFKQKPDTTNLAVALAAFVRNLETGSTPFDRYVRRDRTAMTEAAIRGRFIFMNKGKCFDCHFTPDFTGDEFRNIGLYNGIDLNDLGRFNVTHQEADKGKFKVPGLRNVALTAPYMHDGRFKTLKEVIDYYDRPNDFVANSIGRDSLLAKPLLLTEQERADLEAFLHALTEG
jgi:cytochrome c peroxidase